MKKRFKTKLQERFVTDEASLKLLAAIMATSDIIKVTVPGVNVPVTFTEGEITVEDGEIYITGIPDNDHLLNIE